MGLFILFFEIGFVYCCFEAGSYYIALTGLELQVDQVDLEFTRTCLSHHLGLKVCTTTPGLRCGFLFFFSEDDYFLSSGHQLWYLGVKDS